MWASNSINSTDGRNGRNVINISKRKYNAAYGHIKNNDIIVEERKNKRGIPILTANQRVLTCTVRSIHEKLEEKGIKTSIGKVFSLKPFFLTYATDKEMALCLCKLCLNVKMLSEPLLNQETMVQYQVTPLFLKSLCSIANVIRVKMDTTN